MFVYLAAVVLLMAVPIARAEGGTETGDARAPIVMAMQTTDSTPVDVQLGERRMRIPRNYFHYPPELSENGELLRVLLPDFAPMTEANAHLFATPGFGARVNVLIAAPGRTVPVAKLFAANAAGRTIIAAGDDLPGLVEVEGGYAQGFNDLFAHLENGRATDQFYCTPERPEGGSDCRQNFEHETLGVQLTYDRKYLRDWQRLRAQAVAMIDAFTIR